MSWLIDIVIVGGIIAAILGIILGLGLCVAAGEADDRTEEQMADMRENERKAA